MSDASPLQSMLAFVGTSLLARRWVQLSSRSSRRAARSIGAPGAPPPSLAESLSLGTEEVDALRAQHMSNSCSVSYRNTGPLHIASGYKSRLVDINGVSYLDTRNNVAHVGHGHPEIVRAAQYQMQNLQTNTRYLHPHASLLAKKLADLLPGPLEVVFFVNSGSEANDLALRLARAHGMRHSESEGKKRHIITIDHAYHGHTLATLDVSPYKHRQGREMECPEYVTRVPCPDVYRGLHAVKRPTQPSARSESSSGETERQYCESEAEAAERYASYVERACEEITSQGHAVSAFLMEGGMSVAGVILPPKSYLRRCANAVRRAGGVYVADEVQTGFGRLGTCTWAFQHSNGDESDEIVPDIVTVGKPFGNGMPLAAVVTTREIASSFEALGVEYFNTFAGSPVCCAAGLAMIDVLSKERLQENASAVGEHLMELLRGVQARCGWIGDIRGSGLFLGVEFVRDQETLEPATKETSFVCSVLKDKYKVLTSIDGPNENVLVIKPPMVFSRDDAELFVSRLEQALVEDLPTTNLDELGTTPT
ncbi:hypothetical protein ACHAXT_001078 [Thalassiosira profunda]